MIGERLFAIKQQHCYGIIYQPVSETLITLPQFYKLFVYVFYITIYTFVFILSYQNIILLHVCTNAFILGFSYYLSKMCISGNK